MNDIIFLFTTSAIISFTIIIINLPLVILIYADRRLRRQKECIVIGFICFADLLYAIACCSSDLTRIEILVDGREDLPTTTHDCATRVFLYIFLLSHQLMGASMLTVTLDRAVAVVKPFAYLTYGARYAYSLVGSALSVAILGSAVCIAVWLTAPAVADNAMCFTTTAYTKPIGMYIVLARDLGTLGSILLYVPVTVRVFQFQRDTKALKMAGGGEAQRRLRKTTILIGLTLLCEVVFVVIPDVMLNVNPLGLGQRFQFFWFMAVVTKGLVNVFLYSTKNDDIRAAIYARLPSSIRPTSQRQSSQMLSVIVTSSVVG